MGYTHYWYREKEVHPEVYEAIVDDFKKVLPHLKKVGVRLAGPLGKGKPVINYDRVLFNGAVNCRHADVNIGIAWPAAHAAGITTDVKVAITGSWFAGRTLNKRACDGDCSHETFSFNRVYEPYEWQKPDENGKWFACCKTAFKPYDLAVNVFLIIAKQCLRDPLVVHSDGELEHWADGMELCQAVLGYGNNFRLDE